MQQRSRVVDTTKSQYSELKTIPLSSVKLTDRFWAPRLQANRLTSIRMHYTKLVETGRLDNFLRVSRRSSHPFTEPIFNDSDVYKWLEAAAWSLAAASDNELWSYVDKTIDIVVQAQREDGYINTYYALDRADQRWTNIRDMHELYCAGHLMQAAIAIHRCVGDSRLLHSAVLFANYLLSIFDPEEGGTTIPPGHPEIEMALVELSRETDDIRYLQLASRFLDARGKGLIGGREYHLDHYPFRDLPRLTGHAVRALYLCCGATDIALQTGEQDLKGTLRHLWHHLSTHQMYITGGVGSRYEGEAIGCDYELPNSRAYAETCASIAGVMWAWRMLQMDTRCEYADYIEHTLYNAVLPGISIDGTAFFYTNPLSDNGSHHRASWFECACCPPNLTRLLAMMPEFIYSVADAAIWVHQYVANESVLTLPNGQSVGILQRTRYPWDGNIIIEILDNCDVELNIRIPIWSTEQVEINVNGAIYTKKVIPGSYVKIARAWSVGDSVCMQFDMRIRKVQSHPYIRSNLGQVAIMRGPILFCLEKIDNPNINLLDIVLQKDQIFTSNFHFELLNGIQVIKAEVRLESPENKWDQALYREKQTKTVIPSRLYNMMAIPYFAWGNRKSGQMLIWVRDSPDPT